MAKRASIKCPLYNQASAKGISPETHHIAQKEISPNTSSVATNIRSQASALSLLRMYLGHEAAKGLHDVSKGFTRSIASYCARLLRAMAVARKKAFLQRIRVRFYTFKAAIAKSCVADQTAADKRPAAVEMAPGVTRQQKGDCGFFSNAYDTFLPT